MKPDALLFQALFAELAVGDVPNRQQRGGLAIPDHRRLLKLRPNGSPLIACDEAGLPDGFSLNITAMFKPIEQRRRVLCLKYGGRIALKQPFERLANHEGKTCIRKDQPSLLRNHNAVAHVFRQKPILLLADAQGIFRPMAFKNLFVQAGVAPRQFGFDAPPFENLRMKARVASSKLRRAVGHKLFKMILILAQLAFSLFQGGNVS